MPADPIVPPKTPSGLPMTVTSISAAQRRSILNLVRRAARTEILPRFRDDTLLNIDEKNGPQDVVTEADRNAEAMIARGLIALFPTARIVGEEASAGGEDPRAGLAEAELAFTIDPVDGTWNYAHGLTQFGVIVGATRFGVPIFGLLYDPVMDDAVVAGDGGPAEFLRPGRAPRTLSTSGGGALRDLVGFASPYFMPEEKRAQLVAVGLDVQRMTTLRCACHEFRMVAQGNVDFMLSTGLTPWDHAAGVAAVRRAGGHVALLDGSEYRADAPADGYLLSACNAAVWNTVRDRMAFLLDA